jgi:CheY-like chemotaxis protein
MHRAAGVLIAGALAASLLLVAYVVSREVRARQRRAAVLQRANAYRSQSLANMSHELLTPLNSTLILAKQLAENRKGNLDEEQVAYATTIYTASNELLARINALLGVSNQRTVDSAPAPAPCDGEIAFHGKRILVVDDDHRNSFALSALLEPKGASIAIARNGREAVDYVRANPDVDLVLMDIMMPEMDGLEATRELRNDAALATVPIIALTAKAMADDRQTCLDAGANDYIAKPLDVDKLLSLAQLWIRK